MHSHLVYYLKTLVIYGVILISIPHRQKYLVTQFGNAISKYSLIFWFYVCKYWVKLHWYHAVFQAFSIPSKTHLKNPASNGWGENISGRKQSTPVCFTLLDPKDFLKNSYWLHCQIAMLCHIILLWWRRDRNQISTSRVEIFFKTQNL